MKEPEEKIQKINKIKSKRNEKKRKIRKKDQTASLTFPSSSHQMASGAEGKTCNGKDCGKPAKLQCPTCLKANVPEVLEFSYFCSQDCFKANWAVHKLFHKKEATDAEKDIFPGFKYTGTVRAWPYGPRRTVPASVKKPDYADNGIPTSEMAERGSHTVKALKPDEIQKMRTVCIMGREILDAAGAAVRVGVTTDELDRIVHEETIKRNAYPSPLNYRNFPKSCCTSVNEVICHGIPDTRPLRNGEIVNIDVSVYYDGFHTDLNETFLVGDVDEAGRKLVQNARECLEKAIEMCKPGANYRDVGEVIEKHAKSAGHSVVRSYCGHGVHRLFHCAPSIPHYARNKAVGVMRPGHVFTIEPMINEGTWHDEMWPDNWTAVTSDGKRSAQFEHTLLITETGVEVLTAKRS